MTAIPEPLAGATPVELHIAKLELKPGDVLVLKINREIDHDLAARIQEWAKSVLPPGVKAMVLDEKTDLSVVRAEEAEGR